MGAAFNLRTLGPWSHSSRARADYSKMFNLSDSLGRPLFANIQISLVCAACLKTDEPEKCTHKLAEVRDHKALRKASTSCTDPRSLLADAKMAVVKQDGAHVFSCHIRAILPLNARPHSVCRKLSRESLPTTPPCCFGRAWASPPTARTRPSRRTSSTPSSTARASATFGGTSTLSTTRTPTTSSWPSIRPAAAPRSLPSARRFSCQTGPWSCWAWTYSAQRCVTLYASNARGQFPSRSPR